jgi:hypothetical protein
MNPYTTKGQARIRQRDIDEILHRDAFLVSTSLAILERQRGWQAEAETEWLLKQHGLTAKPDTSVIAMLRQSIGAALIYAGQRLGGAPRSGRPAEAAPSVEPLGMVG